MLSNPQQRGIGFRPIKDANATADRTTSLMAYTELTAARVVSLTSARSFDASQMVLVADASGNCSGSNTITVVPLAGDTINGSTSALVLSTAYAEAGLWALGAGGWIYNAGSGGGSVVAIQTDNFTVTGTTYTLSMTPAGGLFQVFLDGVLQLPANYTLSGTTLTFVGLNMPDYLNLQVIYTHA